MISDSYHRMTTMSTRDPGDTNVLVIVADTARADDAYATNPTVMPTLRDLRSRGTTYTNTFASAPWTLPSHAGLFTGMYSSTHGAHGEHPLLQPNHRTIAEVFAANGYETFAASNNTWISPEFGFDRGFEHFWKGWQLVQSDDDVGSILHELGSVRRMRAALDSVSGGNLAVNAINAIYNHIYRMRGDYGAERTTDHVIEWLESRDRDRPFFGFLNYLEPHIRYQPPHPFVRPFLPDGATYETAMAVRQEPRAYDVGAYDLSTRELDSLRALYRGELAYVDYQIDRICEALKSTGMWDDTLLVILGDHGENIGDHGFLGHQYNIYDSVIHVPLVMVGHPFGSNATVDDLVQLTDIAPTFLDLEGISDAPMSRQTQGVSVHPDAESEREFVVAEYIAPQPPTSVLEDRYGELPPHARVFDRTLRAIRTTDEKLIRGSGGHLEYYRLDRDPGEQQDVAAANPEAVDRLAVDLDTWLGRIERSTATEPVDISRGAKRRLADLGYM